MISSGIRSEMLFPPDDATWLKVEKKIKAYIEARRNDLEQERDPVKAAEIRGQIRAARFFQSIPTNLPIQMHKEEL